jgi:hypothetical protein
MNITNWLSAITMVALAVASNAHAAEPATDAGRWVYTGQTSLFSYEFNRDTCEHQINGNMRLFTCIERVTNRKKKTTTVDRLAVAFDDCQRGHGFLSIMSLDGSKTIAQNEVDSRGDSVISEQFDCLCSTTRWVAVVK